MLITIGFQIDWVRLTELIAHARIGYWAKWHCRGGRDWVLDWCADPAIADHEDDWHEMTTERIVSGLTSIAQKDPHRFADILTGKADGDTGDLLVQHICFGEVLYG